MRCNEAPAHRRAVTPCTQRHGTNAVRTGVRRKGLWGDCVSIWLSCVPPCFISRDAQKLKRQFRIRNRCNYRSGAV